MIFHHQSKSRIHWKLLQDFKKYGGGGGGSGSSSQHVGGGGNSSGGGGGKGRNNADQKNGRKDLRGLGQVAK